MKKVLLLMAVVLFSGFIAPPHRHTRHHHSMRHEFRAEDKMMLISQLKDSRENLLKSIAGLTDAQLQYKPAPDRWSIIENVEHISIIEKMLMDTEKNLMSQPADPAKKKDLKYTDESLLTMVEDRSKKQKTPDFGMPKHNYASPADAVDAFVRQRDGLIDYVATTKDKLRDHITDNPNIGTIDAYQLLLFDAGHTARHIKQIEEVKADPGFPK
ncbi:DinB family protein [Chitinophaga flava]|uniref:DinB family protein n=1 Tax=Chitinophaga flava TaxID=2259036 RepID=A0A365Y123_9BACT|nr:DinB family protein [Chitinophaga flava]RBL92316.1 DinB family protein [Chitinophaga flava]